VQSDVLTGLNASTTLSSEQDRKVVGIVSVSIGHTRSEYDHTVVQKVRVSFLDRAKFREEASELFDMPAIDFLVLSDFLRVVFMV
jgi:hypothetical protein